MKVKLSQLQNAIPSLNILLQTKLTFKASYDVSKRVRIINSELDLFNKMLEERRKELTSDNKEKSESEIKESKEKFQSEIQELLDGEVEIDLIPLKQEYFADISIEPVYLLNLHFLIADEIIDVPAVGCGSEHEQ